MDAGAMVDGYDVISCSVDRDFVRRDSLLLQNSLEVHSKAMRSWSTDVTSCGFLMNA